MRTGWLFLFVIALGLVAMPVEATPLTVMCVGGNFVDNDADGVVVVAGCLLPGGATMSGTIREERGSNYYKLIASPLTLTGPGAGMDLIAQGDYGAFIGDGLLRTVGIGFLGGAATAVGGEFIQFSSQASTFNNNPALTGIWPGVATMPLPQAFALSAQKEGWYSGEGTLYGYVNYALPAGETYTLPNSAEFLAGVPEPGTLALFLAGGVLLIVGCRRR